MKWKNTRSSEKNTGSGTTARRSPAY